MALETEVATYTRLKPQLLLHHTGKFALIHGEEFIEAFDTLDNAYAAGIKHFGLDPFMIRKVREKEPVIRMGFPSIRTHARL